MVKTSLRFLAHYFRYKIYQNDSQALYAAHQSILGVAFFACHYFLSKKGLLPVTGFISNKIADLQFYYKKTIPSMVIFH